MKLAYFDCISEISGDLVLGASVDAVADMGCNEAKLAVEKKREQ